MSTILVILFVALVVAGVVVYFRGRERVATPAGPAGLSAGSGSATARSDVRSLRPGDVVNHDGGDFVVEGTLRLEQDGFRWAEHRLVDGPRSLWLSVEDDEGLEVAVWDRSRGLDLQPGPTKLMHDGVSYELDERGHASYTAEGSTGTGGGGRMEFVDYAAGDRRLSFERFGDDAGWEIGLGMVISEHALDVYPSRDA